MNIMKTGILQIAGLVLAASCFGAVISPDIQKEANGILKEAGTTGGLIVQLGCGDGSLTAALHANDSFIVQGLDVDAASVEKARSTIRSTGLYGAVTADRFDGRHLPYVDNLVNLVVAENPGDVSMDEVMRVLAPNGVAWIGGKKTVKPWPKEIDEWTHYLHDAGNNAVAHDTVVGTPKGMQWFAGPLYCRSHEYDSSVSALVSAAGRIFYIVDDGPTGVIDPRFPQQWSLCARDAFSGVLLWKIPVPDWGWPEWKSNLANLDWSVDNPSRLSSPVNLPRRLVAVGKYVYATLGYNAAVSMLDAATGKVVRTYPGSENTDEILCSDGVLLVAVRKDRPVPGEGKAGKTKKKGAAPPAGTDYLMAFDSSTGKLLWQTKPAAIAENCVAMQKGRAFYHTLDHLVCLDLRTGKELWRASSQSGYGGLFAVDVTLVAYGDQVLFNGPEMETYSAETGKLLWSKKALKGPGRFSPPDLFVANGCVWSGRISDELVEGLDPQTGKVKQEIDLQKLINPWHHYRCYRSKATDNYLIWSKQGAEFIDLKGHSNMRNDWFRGPCRYGLMPCNGMLYFGPHQCSCFGGVLLNGFNALVPRSSAQGVVPVEQPRLEKGPAFGNVPVSAAAMSDADWPMFRATPLRNGGVGTSVPSVLAPIWQAKLEGKLSQPVVAGGRMYVCETETDRVLCLDCKDGHLLWSVTVGGRVDSPPTIHKGMVVFGSNDGWVYSLRATDGALVWRYRVAPAERNLVSMGQVESVWPVHGAVLVQNGVVYAAAGRSTFLDDGIFLCALDPVTGKLLHEAQLQGPVPNVAVDNGSGRSSDGARADVLVGDGKSIYLRQVMFDADLQQQGSWGDKQCGSAEPGSHLYASSDLLDDAGFDRTGWRYGDGQNLGQGGAQMLAFDDKTIYSALVFSKHLGRGESYFPGEEYVELSAKPIGQQMGGRKSRKNAADNGDGWKVTVPIFVRAMGMAGKTLFVAGMPDVVYPESPLAALEGRAGGVLWVVSALDGKKLAEYRLDAPPIFDGLIVADGCVYLSLADGQVICLGKK